MRSVVPVLLAAILLFAPATTRSDAPERFETSGESGAKVIHITADAPLEFEAVVQSPLIFGHNDALRVTFLAPNGTVLASSGYDLSSKTTSEGAIAFVGAEGILVQNPDLEEYAPIVQTWDWHFNLGVSEAYMVMVWGGFREDAPEVWDIAWPAGVTTTVTDGDASFFLMQDYDGLRAGSATAFGVHLAGDIEFDAEGGDIIGSFAWQRRRAVNFGHTTLEYGSTKHTVDLSYVNTDPIFEQYSCINWDGGRYTFTTDEDVRSHLEYVGLEEETQVVALFGRLPAGTLPMNAWREEYAPPYPCAGP